jgi:hypothetical protein
MDFEYPHLDQAKNKICLISFPTPTLQLAEEPSAGDKASLDEQLDHYALSYVLGDLKDSKPTQINGETLLATTNLFATLKEVSLIEFRSKRMTLWVDANCVNQNDEDEKAGRFNSCKGLIGRQTL